MALAESATPAKDLFAQIKKSPSLMITLGVVVVVGVYWLWQRQSSANAPASQAASSNLPSGYAPALGTYTYEESVNNPGQPPIVNVTNPITVVQPTQTGTTPPPPPKTPPPVTKGKPNAPIIPFGKLPAGNWFVFGKQLTWNGITYTVGPGSGGILWGVPGRNIPFNQWQNTPIAPAGTKVRLYGPKSLY